MVKQFTQKYAGMSQDITLSKTNDSKYWSAKNIRITATDEPSTFSITNEYGNISVLSIPIPVINTATTSIDYTVGGVQKSLLYKTINNNPAPPRCQIEEEFEGKTSGTQLIIGIEEARDSVIIITTDDNGFDCVWEFVNLNSGSYGLNLLYMNNLALSSNHPVQIIYNYENSIIEKVYFVDGINQLRFMNIRQSQNNGDLINLADMDPSSIDTVSNFELSQPSVLDVVGGGAHTSGMVQYAYGLYVLNGSQTTLSPLSELTPIDRGTGLGGGDLNEQLGKSVIIDIPNIDVNYTHIKIYLIKYTSFNQDPEISVIADKEIDNYTSLNHYDNGTKLYGVSLSQFLFLGSSPKIPQHVATKDSRMVLLNIKEKTFDVDIDMRAYSHKSDGSVKLMENAILSGNNVVGNTLDVNTTTYAVPPKHDAINYDYNSYLYQKNGSTYGGEGLFVKVELFQGLNLTNAKDLKFFKDRELYRLGVEFYNGRGQVSNPKWVMDFLSLEGNLEGKYNQLKVTLKPEFYVWLNDSSNFADDYAKPIGYRILRADRQLIDKTVVAQGILNPTVSNYPHTEKTTNLSERKSNAEDASANKMPSLLRTFQDETPVLGCKNYHLLNWNSISDSTSSDFGNGSDRETYKAAQTSDYKAQTHQFNKLMMLYSPEVSFSDISLDSSLQVKVKGLHLQNDVNLWSTERHITSGLEEVEAKFKGGLNYRTAVIESIKEDPSFLNDFGLWGAANSDDKTGFNQIERDMTGGFVKNTNSTIFDIFGTPELAERGADFTAYNGNHKLRYANHLKALLQDDFRHSGHVHEDAQTQVVGANSYGERCIVLMEGNSLDNAMPIETMKSLTSISQTNGVMIVELRKPEHQLYLGGSYGGNSYESKSISSYISIGAYTDISSDNIYIESPGDTFVQDFTFVKTAKTDIELRDRSMTQMTEIVSFPVETSIDLKNRNDLSLEAWDNRFQPRYDEYMKYNSVYSQSPTLVKTIDPGFKFKKVSDFDTRIIASKEKIAGENIDSWTDYLENEQQHLDGRYGPINGVINASDEIFTFQDSGVARLAINPRVQTTGSDGLAIELGTGRVLHGYNYLTTVSGALNKWAIKSTDKGFYYFDLLNKSIMRGNVASIMRSSLASRTPAIENISDREGLHQHLINNINYNELVPDLPLKDQGVLIGYNSTNKDVYFTFKQSTNPFTLGFNEKPDAFVSFYDFTPSFYINKGIKMLTVGPDGYSLWEHFKGERSNFYGQVYPSKLIFNVNTGVPNKDATFNNIAYRSEMVDANGVELPLNTLDFIRCYNEYQDSGQRALVFKRNLMKRNRQWYAQIPRNLNSRDRIKSPWAYVEFTFTNEQGHKIILHDMNIFYTVY